MADRNQVDTRVRLSAEGQQEIIRAFQQVQREGQRAGRSLEKTFGALRRLLPAISFVAVTAGLVAMGKRAAEAADGIGKLQQKTGIAVETLSVLSFASRTADVAQEQLNSNLIRATRTFDDYDKGVSTARDAVRSLFGAEKALQGLSTDERLRRVLTEIGKLESGAKKTGAAISFFGKSGAALLPLINDLAVEGFGELTERARRLGHLFTQETIDATTRANDALTTMKLVSEGLANQFVAGLAPALAQTADAIVDSVAGKGVSAFEKLGEVAGKVIKFIAAGFNTLTTVLGGFYESAGIIALNTIDLIKDLARGEGTRAILDFAFNTKRALQDVENRVTEGVLKFQKKLEEPPKAPPRRARGAEIASEDQAALAQIRQLNEARLRFQQAALDNELALFRAKNKLIAEADKQRFEEGLLSVQEFFEQRRQILEAETAKELEILRQQAEAIRGQIEGESRRKLGTGETEETRQKRLIDLRLQLAKTETQAELQRIELQGQLADLAGDQIKAVRESTAEQLQAEAALLAAQGQRFAAARIELAAQIAALQRLKGESDADFAARQQSLQRAGEARITFEEAENQARVAFAELDRQRQAIQARVSAGQIGQLQGEIEIAEIERQRLPTLQAIADAVLVAAIATKDPALIESARALSAEVQNLEVNTQRLEVSWENFKDRAEGAITNDLVVFLTHGVTQAKSFGDAMRQLALSVVQSLQRIAAEMLVTYLISKLLGGVFGFAGGGLASGGGGGFDFSGLITPGGAASGGLMRGPGSGTSDSIPAWLSNREFVVRAAVTKQPGMVRFLSELNRHGWPALNLVQPRRRFADGGLVEALGGMDLGAGRGELGIGRADLNIGLDPRLLVKDLESNREFDRVLVRVLERNRKAVNNALGHNAI